MYTTENVFTVLNTFRNESVKADLTAKFNQLTGKLGEQPAVDAFMGYYKQSQATYRSESGYQLHLLLKEALSQ